MQRRSRRAFIVVGAFAALNVGALVGASIAVAHPSGSGLPGVGHQLGHQTGHRADAEAEVQSDDGQDRYVGSGGLILPSSHPRRDEVAECPDCQWRLSTPCHSLDLGQAFSETTTCESVTRGCAAQQQMLRLWFRRPGAPWQDLGVLCLGEGGPITVARVGERVRAEVARDLPALRPTAQPSRGVVTQIPVAFDTRQPREWGASMEVLGLPIDVTAQPQWHWQFGDGALLDTADPGGRYPHLAVSHVFRRAGGIVVAVDARWTARFTADGLGPFPVAGPIVQSGRVAISVGEGRALLAAPPG